MVVKKNEQCRFLGILAFDEKNNEASMSNIVMLHLTSNGDYSTDDDLNQQPLNHPVKSSMTGRLDIIIGNITVPINTDRSFETNY